MRYSLDESLIQIYNSFINQLNTSNNAENNEWNDQPPIIYNPTLFQPENIINFFPNERNTKKFI